MFQGQWHSAAGRARERASAFYRGRSPLGALGAGLFTLVLMVLIAVPLLVFVCLMLLGFGVATLGRAALRLFGRAKEPNGVLDGRKNVRVRMPGDSAEA